MQDAHDPNNVAVERIESYVAVSSFPTPNRDSAHAGLIRNGRTYLTGTGAPILAVTANPSIS